MARPRKKPEYNKDNLQNQLVSSVVDLYQHPPKGMADASGHMHLSMLAEEFGMTSIKIRKILVTAGVYDSPVYQRVIELYEAGKSVSEICKLTELSVASVNGYLPYKKAIYKMEERTLLAERLVKYRRRKEAVETLKCCMNSETSKEEEKRLKISEALDAFAGYRFQTSKGVRFDYRIDEKRVWLSEEESYAKDEIIEMADMRNDAVDERIETVLRRFDIKCRNN